MAKKSTTEKAKEQLAGAAKIGADAVRDIAGQAIRAAAVAAVGVALQRGAEALRGGARAAESAVPKAQQPAGEGKATKRAKTTKRAKAKKSTAKSATKKSAKKAKKSRRSAR